MAITITQQPVFGVVNAGQQAEFLAGASGATGVQWYWQPPRVSGYTAISGANSSYYQTPVTGVTGHNGALYLALFSNGVDLDVSTEAVPLWVVANYLPADGRYGSGTYGGQLYKYEASEEKRHYYAIRKIWPIKTLEEDPNHDAEVEIEGRYLDYCYDEGQKLLREIFPDTTELLVGDWERMLRLSNLGDLGDRQSRIVTKLRARGGLSRRYYIGLSDTIMQDTTGYTGSSITEGSTLQFVVSTSSPPATQLPAPIFNPDVKYTWYLNVFGITGPNSELERQMNDLKPAWTEVAFTYTP